MAHEPRKIKVVEGSDLARLLAEVDAAPLFLEKDGAFYRVERMKKDPSDMFASYDPVAALAGIEETAGSWNDIDPEAFKAQLYRAREEGTRSYQSP